MKKTEKKVKLFLSFSVLFFMSFIYAETYVLENLLDETTLKELTTKGEIKHTLEKGESELKLIPNTEFIKSKIVFQGGTDEEEPSYASEALYYIKKSELSEKSGKQLTDISVEEVSRILRSISKMKGMQYWSNSRQKWDTLYKESYLIAGPDSKEKIPDQIEGSADGLKLYCFQDEHAFGDSRYVLDYNQTANEVSVRFQNLESLKYKIFRAVKKGNMNINLFVTDCGDSFVVYMAIQAKILRFSILEQRMEKSLSSRLDAIYKWFKEQF